MLKIDLTADLPCGHTITMSCSHLGDATPESIPLFLRSASERLDYWFKDRATRHRCDLVSPENRNGIEPWRPKTPKEP